MREVIPAIAMWLVIGVAFVSLGQCFRVEQVEMRRKKQVDACQKIRDPQAQADCIGRVGR